MEAAIRRTPSAGGVNIIVPHINSGCRVIGYEFEGSVLNHPIGSGISAGLKMLGLGASVKQSFGES